MMEYTIEELPVQERILRLEHHVRYINYVLDSDVDVDPDWYELVMRDLDIVSDLQHDPHLDPFLRELRAEAMEFYDDVFRHIRAIALYFQEIVNALVYGQVQGLLIGLRVE
jgi:hypothetical protein